MVRVRRPRVAVAVVAAALFLACAGRSAAYYEDDPTFEGAADNGEFSLGIGYTRIEFDGGGDLIDDRDGIHFDPVISFAPFHGLPQLRLGGAFGISAALDDTRGAIISHDGQLVVISGSDVTLMLFEPELRISWRQQFGPDGSAWFIEAGAGGGGVAGWLDAGDGDDDSTDIEDDDFDESDFSWMARAFARIGWHVSTGIVGIEASYLRGGELDFDEAGGGEVSEAYIGVFGALTF